MRTPIAVLLTLAFALSACGSNEPTEDVALLPNVAADRVVDSPAEATAPPNGDLYDIMLADLVADGVPADDADCTIRGVIDRIGEERLIELGAANPEATFEGDDMSDAEEELMVDVSVGCMDIDAFLSERMTSDWGAATAACMMPLVEAQHLRDVVRAELLNDPVAAANAQALLDQNTLTAAQQCGLADS